MVQRRQDSGLKSKQITQSLLHELLKKRFKSKSTKHKPIFKGLVSHLLLKHICKAIYIEKLSKCIKRANKPKPNKCNHNQALTRSISNKKTK